MRSKPFAAAPCYNVSCTGMNEWQMQPPAPSQSDDRISKKSSRDRDWDRDRDRGREREKPRDRDRDRRRKSRWVVMYACTLPLRQPSGAPARPLYII